MTKQLLSYATVALLAAGVLMGQTQPARQKATIEGTVVRAGTGQPLRGVRVTIRRGNADSQPGVVYRVSGFGAANLDTGIATATTDGNGRFTFTGVDAGQYRVTAERDGFIRAEYGQRSPTGKGTPVSVNADQRFAIELRLLEASVISGRVVNESGDPVSDTTVSAYTYQYSNGQRTLDQVASGQTNDMGEYRLFWLQPGEHFVAVNVSSPAQDSASVVDLSQLQSGRQTVAGISVPAGRVIVSPDAKLVSLANDPGNLTVFYPGTADLDASSPVRVVSGAETRGVDFSLRPIRTATLRGRVISPFSLTPPNMPVTVRRENAVQQVRMAAHFQLNLARRGSASLPGSSITVPVNADGEFEIKGVAPGSYNLTAKTTESDQQYTARTRVDVGTTDVNNLVVELRASVEVRGRLSFESAPPQGFKMSQTRVSLVTADSAGASGKMIYFASAGDTFHFDGGAMPGAQMAAGTVNEDGTFSIPNIGAMEYRVRVEGLPPGAYLQSGRLGSADALNAPFTVDAQNSSLQLLVGVSPGRVTGTVVDARSNPAPGSTAVLVPDAARRGRSDAYFTATASQNGQFTFSNVPPGAYKLFAWDDVPAGAYQHPEFLRPYEDLGVPVSVQPLSTSNSDIRVILP